MVTLEKAVELLKSGEAVAFPTETVYGLGADAWNHAAVRKVFEIKGRPSDNPLIVHVAKQETVDDFALEIPEAAKKLMNHFWPGPLTLIFKKRPEVPDIITGGLGTVALRWPNHPISQQLIYRAGPLVAPSANTSGRPSPTRAEHVIEDFGKDFPLLDGGKTEIGLESTVLDISQEPFTIYRPGNIGKDEIERIIDKPVRLDSGQEPEKSRSPGTRYSHYAPDAEVRWLKSDEHTDQKNTLYLHHYHQPTIEASNIIFYNKNYKRMANELYDRFRQADREKFDEVVIEPFNEQTMRNHTIIEALKNRINKALDRF